MVPSGDFEPATSSFEAVVVAGGPRVADLMARAESLLAESCRGYGDLLAVRAESTLAAGGKRLRPLLVFLCGTPEQGERIVRVGASVELVHMATLVHDDVVDEAPLRRGRPTILATDGAMAALATGDFLFARALNLLMRNHSARQATALAEASVALSQGEFAQRRDAYAAEVSRERYLLRCDLKTGRLFAAACVLGGLSAGREEGELAALESYGSSVGRAFQMLDDVLDVSGPADLTGKRPGTDLLEGATTLPLIVAKERDSSLQALDLKELRSHADAEAVCERIAATGALDQVRSEATEIVAQAKQRVGQISDADLRESLHTVADGIVERYA